MNDRLLTCYAKPYSWLTLYDYVNYYCVYALLVQPDSPFLAMNHE